jgi:CubicO group peptidase (beta-lactamase class C family)
VLPAQDRFKYSNTAYGLLGLVVAAVTGEPYDTWVAREVVQRLGLRHTGPDLDPARAADLATGHTALSYADARLPIAQVGTGAFSPATGFWSTAEDVCTYASAHFDGDPRLLSDDAKRRMRRVEWEVPPEEGATYGLGLAGTRVGDRRLVGHGGGWPGHITSTLFDPVARLAVSVFTNAIDGPASSLAEGVVRLVDLAASQDETDADTATRARFVGRYANLWGVLDVADLGGRLFALDPTQPEPTATALALRVEDDATLRIVSSPGYGAPGEALAYTFDEDGSVRSVRGNGGTTSVPLAVHQARLAGLSRVEAPA